MTLLLILPLLLLAGSASAAPIAFGDVVVLTGSSVVRLDAANAYAPDAPVPVTLTNPRAIDVAPDGTLYVLDLAPNRIIVIGPGGSQRPFTPVGTRPWGPSAEDIEVFLVDPRDMALGREGLLWVADQGFRVQDPQWGFDGTVVSIDPSTGALSPSAGPPSPVGQGTSPRRLDVGATAGGVLVGDGQNIASCGASGCELLVQTRDVTVLADGRIVVNGHRLGEVDAIADVFVFDSAGTLLDELVDATVAFPAHVAGGDGAFYFTDTPNTLARFDLQSGTWAQVYNAGEPILDLAVQQVPEPSSLWMLAVGVVATARRRRPRGVPMLLVLAVALALLPPVAAAAPIAFGDVVVLTGTGVVRLDRANAYAPDPQTPIGLSAARAVDVAEDGTVYVLDGPEIVGLVPDGAQRRFTPTGTRPWGPNGEEIEVSLVGPADMALGRDGRLWVADQSFRVQDPDWGFDGYIVFVDPATGDILPGHGGGTSPRRIDVGPFGGEALIGDGQNIVGCVPSGCQVLVQGRDAAVLRDGRIVVNGHRVSEFDAVADVFVFSSDGELLDEIPDATVAFPARIAGGIGEFYFLDTPTSVARFDLETGTWAPIYDAGVPIFDLAVQQIPEPGSLVMLAAALALTLRRRSHGSVRRWPGP